MSVPDVSTDDESTKSAPRPWGFWMTLVWLGIAAAVGLGVVTAVSLLEAHSDWELTSANEEVVVHFGTALALAVLAVSVRWCGWSVFDYFAVQLPRGRNVWLGLAVLTAWELLSNAALTVLGWGAEDGGLLTEEYRNARSAGILPLFWIAHLLVAPISEEAVFRGFMYRGWAASALGPVGTILVTSMIFGVIHTQYTWAGMLDIAVFGLIAGWMRWRSRSLLVPIFLHFASNLAATLYAMSQA